MEKGLLLCVLYAFLSLTADAEQTGRARRILGADDSTHRLSIIAPDGHVEWETSVGPIHDASVLENGNILYQLSWQKIAEVTPEKKCVWEYDAGKMKGNAGKRVEVDAFQRLPNGWTMIAESGTARIIEVDQEAQSRDAIKEEVRDA